MQLVLLEVLWYRFSTNRAARLWTASNLSMLFWVYGSHTDEAYSSMGLTKALYALSFMALTGANLQIAPQKTKCPASLVCHVVDVVIPVHILLYGDAKVLGAGNGVTRVWPCNSYASSRVDSYSW